MRPLSRLKDTHHEINALLGLALLVLAVVATSHVRAEPPTRESSEWRFKELDANGDKRLSEQEYTAEKSGKSKAKAKKQFKSLDKNRDESLSYTEYAVKWK